MTSGGEFEDKEVSKQREVIIVLGYQLPEPGHLAEFCLVEDKTLCF
jgi:hypothetical protein